MPPFRLFEALGRCEGTILTAGPGGRKNSLMSEKERESIRRRYRHFDNRGDVDASASSQEQRQPLNALPESAVLAQGLLGSAQESRRSRFGNDRRKAETGLMQRAGLLVEEDNDGDDGNDGGEKDEACPDLTPQIENIKRTIRDIEKLIEDWKRKIQETEAKISDIAFEIVITRIQLGLSIIGGLLKLIPPARIPGIIVSAMGVGKTKADLFQKEKELANAQSELSTYQDELNQIEQRLTEAQSKLEKLLARQKECQNRDNGEGGGKNNEDKLV